MCCSVRRKVCKACDVGGGGLSGDLKVLTLQMCKAYPADDDATTGVSTGAVVGAHARPPIVGGLPLGEPRDLGNFVGIERANVGRRRSSRRKKLDEKTQI